MIIIPSILTNDKDELSLLLSKAEDVVERVQIDVVDHKFADNITVDPEILKTIKTNLDLDFHLMVKNPIEWIDHCIQGGEHRIIGQIEEMESQKAFVEKVITESKVGLAVDLPTPIERLDQDVLSKVNVVLLMSVKAGWGGQEFDLEVFSKIEKLDRLRKELKLRFRICVDGGVTKKLVEDMEKAGVDEVAIGRRILEGDLEANLKMFNG
ncbi:MAG TPA: hypothetical protein VLE44_00705 [Candidatus Saccharimonadales bacterium]|nr:hypothetical protein [Candidatus Saccharimonadales bacterium]